MALTETHFHRTESSPGLSMSTVHCPCPMSTRLMVKVWDVRRANPPDGSTRLQPTPIGGRGFESLILCPRLCEVDVHCVSMVVITRISSPYSVCDMIEKEKKTHTPSHLHYLPHLFRFPEEFNRSSPPSWSLSHLILIRSFIPVSSVLWSFLFSFLFSVFPLFLP